VRIINNDGTVGKDIDLLYDKDYMNITIIDMGYDLLSMYPLADFY
jgi:hypothetical protein